MHFIGNTKAYRKKLENLENKKPYLWQKFFLILITLTKIEVYVWSNMKNAFIWGIFSTIVEFLIT